MKKILFIYHELFSNEDNELYFMSSILKIKSMLSSEDIVEIIAPVCIWEKVKDNLSGIINEAILINYDFNYDNYNEKAYINSIILKCSEKDYTHIFMCSSFISRKIACEIAVNFGVSSIADVFDIEMVDTKFQYIRTTSENKLLSHIICDKCPEIATLKLSDNKESFSQNKYAVNTVNVTYVDIVSEKSSILNITKNEIRHMDYRKDVIVGIGRGVKAEIIPLIKEICDAHNVRLMGSRPVVEEGLISKSNQIGQSGVSIHADTYIAIGISGAMQHIIGILDCKRIIAINYDKNANIHKIANVCIPIDIEKIIESRILNDLL